MTIRVRFAPSPTGFLHIGNARAALINWLFAKKHGGEFILRLDDTDLERSTQEYTQSIFEDMAWLGLKHDQFFKQSDRFDRYKQVFEDLKQKGLIYPCYETKEELDFKRKRQLSRKEPPLYDRSALSLTEEQKQTFEKEGRIPHWRFKLEDEAVRWNDLIRGDVHFQKNSLSDPVLIREDGVVLYTFASVVDDVDTNITHIVRGEDHVSNTAVQIQLFKALGKKEGDITFAHTTLLMDAQGQPLSKRLGSLSLRALRELGVEAMSINSLLAHLGTSHNIEAYPTLEALLPHFDLESFSRTPPRFDEKELYHLNQKLYHHWDFKTVKDHLPSGVDESLWLTLRGNISKFSELQEWIEICYGDQKGVIIDAEYIKQAKELLPATPWDESTWATWTNAIKEKTNRKGKDLFMPLRLALTGKEHGPEMKGLLVLIGREKVDQRLL